MKGHVLIAQLLKYNYLKKTLFEGVIQIISTILDKNIILK